MKKFNIVVCVLLSVVTVSCSAMEQAKQGPSVRVRPERLTVDLSLARQDSLDGPSAPRHKPLQKSQGWPTDISESTVLASVSPTTVRPEELNVRQPKK